MINKVFLIGNLGKDPELKWTANGKAVANFPVATSEKWKGADGEMQERTEWHNIVVWGKTAEICAQYLAKGRQVFIEGSLRTESYEKDGVKKYATKVVAQNVKFLGQKPGGTQENSSSGGPQEPAGVDDDIPF